MTNLKQLMIKARLGFDLTDKDQHEGLTVLCEKMMATRSASKAGLRAACGRSDAPLEYRIASKIAESRLYLRSVERPVRIGVVYAMWGERKRLQPRSEVNPLGEDSLRAKLDQLSWATHDTPVEWDLYPIDDGCPEESGRLAGSIAESHACGDRTHVAFLADHTDVTDGPLGKLQSADDSRKAGAIILGCMKAIEDGADAVIYTDADNSVHLGQIGILLQPWLEQNFPVVLGNRKHTDSVLVKSSDRWGPGIKVLRHMQRMVGAEIFNRGIRDTQAAFKLFDAKALANIIESPTVYDFSFDTDWLAAAIAGDMAFEQVPFAFVDSEAESASAKQNPMTTWETLLLGLNKAMTRYDLLKTPASTEMSNVLNEEIHDYRDLEALIEGVPTELASARDADLGNPDIMTPGALREWIQNRKAKASTQAG